MGAVYIWFTIRSFHNPEAVKTANRRAPWRNMPVAFFRALGFLWGAVAILFFYLAVNPPSK
jgi:hypothetical protein